MSESLTDERVRGIMRRIERKVEASKRPFWARIAFNVFRDTIEAAIREELG